jgi:hypothetical protein
MKINSYSATCLLEKDSQQSSQTGERPSSNTGCDSLELNGTVASVSPSVTGGATGVSNGNGGWWEPRLPRTHCVFGCDFQPTPHGEGREWEEKD